MNSNEDVVYIEHVYMYTLFENCTRHVVPWFLRHDFFLLHIIFLINLIHVFRYA